MVIFTSNVLVVYQQGHSFGITLIQKVMIYLQGRQALCKLKA